MRKDDIMDTPFKDTHVQPIERDLDTVSDRCCSRALESKFSVGGAGSRWIVGWEVEKRCYIGLRPMSATARCRDRGSQGGATARLSYLS
jgi:hypothetical protein